MHGYVFFLPLLQREITLGLLVGSPGGQSPSNSHFKRSKFFPLRIDPIYKGGKNETAGVIFHVGVPIHLN